MFNFGNSGLEGVLWNDYNALADMLDHGGYSPMNRINGFVVYQLQKPNEVYGLKGRFLALRESRLEQNIVGTAIFGTCSSLEDAVEALGKLPAGTVWESAKDDVFGYKSLGVTLATGFGVGFLTSNPGIGVGALALFLACKAVYSFLRSYNRWQSALSVFGDPVEGGAALSAAIEFAKL